ncbi:MAG: phosphate starvation-inducible protein PhoH, predicted ATPase [Solidesulfovibrio magneticus str. Maddingley MBC34]|jgi:phosphate starvation-inducible PhoH-like protein|uniref:PhoH-like protein n=1 Tax=Solidesulfovibrio magneticus str. Maddingley MBC34 TaxID=1206767 RepID=K6GMA2_9BACT|nr:MAG: phosphate starvation-inducible protein PhoH, predicted ATPase [Solidesulfovibrio magneticus str. Maddingley MBC34]
MMETLCMERRLDFDDPALARDLFGPHNANIALIAGKSGARLDTRGSSVILRADSEETLSHVANVLVQLYGLLRQGKPIYPADVEQALSVLAREPEASLQRVYREESLVISPKKTVTPRTATQRDYLAAIRRHDLVFGIGPAGTGKTYLAVAMGVGFLLERRVKRLILTRPAVEAGEKLGFLPGDMVEKINPYLRPLYDALNDMLDFRKVREMLDTGVIEVAPLAFMRGRTLNDALIILDEAQNTTPEQMKMFLTRLGLSSKAVVTGDATQIDLPSHTASGLVEARRVLRNVRGIEFVTFSDADVVRHPLVGRIVQAYERDSRQG